VSSGAGDEDLEMVGNADAGDPSSTTHTNTEPAGAASEAPPPPSPSSGPAADPNGPASIARDSIEVAMDYISGWVIQGLPHATGESKMPSCCQKQYQ
jgi:hypothetical protein